MSAELQGLRQENAASLDKMRQTVDEKLSHTLEQRLGESFNLVGQRLEQVHQGLGEMQSLAAGVVDLQRLLRNVKIRGTWGEIQLGAILGEVMIPAQYAANVAVNPLSSERVEYALKIPQSEGETLWLPIDSKFPLEDYQRLQAALEAGDSAARAQAANALGKRVLAAAAEIAAKYIAPPYTTDFAILFLPIEGLYAEVLQQSGLCDTMQREYRVLVAGPTTLSALLNVLQVGYRNLAVQEQAGEVWRLLGVVKAEFAAFGEALAKSQKKLQEAGNALELTGRRTRAMERKLRQVEIAGSLTDSADSADSTGLGEVTSEE